MAGSYTWARGYEDIFEQINGVDALRINDPLPNVDQRRDLQEHVVVASYQYEIPRASSLFGENKVVGRGSRQLAHFRHQHLRHWRSWHESA